MEMALYKQIIIVVIITTGTENYYNYQLTINNTTLIK